MEDNKERNPQPLTASGLMTFGTTKVATWKVIVSMISLVTSLIVGMTLLASHPANIRNKADYADLGKSAHSMQESGEVRIETTHELLQVLKELNLWEAEMPATVPPVLFAGFPENFHELDDMATRKKAFLHTLLPTVLIALQEVQQERNKLENILKKIGNIPGMSPFKGGVEKYSAFFSDPETEFIKKLMKKYRTSDAEELLHRVDVIPVSLILGQSAIESSWGGSRFARAGNNLFGIWTWGERGIVPARREEGKTHKIKIYDTILDSVRSYVLTLNRLGAYRDLREIRRNSKDSMEMAQGLLYYSERRDAYVEDVKRVISTNNLQRYDSINLASTGWWPDFVPQAFSTKRQSTL
jgi:Bax protein